MSTDTAAPAAADLTAQYTDVCAQIVVLEDQRAGLESRLAGNAADRQAVDEAYQKQCQDLTAERLSLRQQREGLTRQIENLKKTRDSLGVEKQVQDHVQAAAAARAEAEKSAADLAEKNKLADELIAKLKAQAAAGENKEESKAE